MAVAAAEGAGEVGHDDEAGGGEEGFDVEIEVGEERACEGVEEGAEEAGAGAEREEFVEDGDAAAGAEDAGGFAGDELGVGRDGENEVEDHDVEGGVGERERAGIAFAQIGGEPEACGAGAGVLQHAGGNVETGDVNAGWEVVEVEAGATADDQDMRC